MAAKENGLIGLLIRPLCCYNPSTTQRSCFNFYLCDRSNDTSAKFAVISKVNNKANYTDEGDNQRSDQYSSHLHTLC